MQKHDLDPELLKAALTIATALASVVVARLLLASAVLRALTVHGEKRRDEDGDGHATVWTSGDGVLLGLAALIFVIVWANWPK